MLPRTCNLLPVPLQSQHAPKGLEPKWFSTENSHLVNILIFVGFEKFDNGFAAGRRSKGIPG